MVLARDVLPGLMAAFIALCTLSLGARAWVRLVMTKSFGYDDWTMLLAYVGYVVYCIMLYISVGLGYSRPVMLPTDQPVLAAKYFMIATMIYTVIVGITKVSCALVLYRIVTTNRKGVRRFLEVSMVIIVIWTIVSEIILLTQCKPLPAAWGEVAGKCVEPYVLSNLGYSISAMDISSSFIYAFMPVYLMHGVQLRPKVKISIIVLLGLGAVSCIATVLRLKSLLDLRTLSADPMEIANKYLATMPYSTAETGLTIFTASLPALRPLLKYVGDSSTGGSGGSGAAASRNNNTKGSRHDAMGRSVQLNDLEGSRAGSEEDILATPPSEGISKEIEYTVEHHHRRE